MRGVNLNQKGVIQFIFLIILLAGITAGVYLVQKTQIFQPKAYQTNAAAITTLTNRLVNAKERYGQNQESKNEALQTMISIASQRKAALLAQIKTNPQAFLDNASLVDQRNQFPEGVKPYIERRVEDKGGFLTVHSDNFKQKISDMNYALLAEKAQYELHFAQDPPQPATGTEVNVNGIGLDDQLVLASGTSINNQIIRGDNFIAPSKFKIGVMLVTFTKMRSEEKADEALDAEIIQDTLFADNNSVRDYFLKASFNRLSLEGDIIGAFTVDQDTSDCSLLKRIKLATELEKHVSKEVVDKYDSIVYIFPPLQSCKKDGEATLGKPSNLDLKDRIATFLWGLDLTKTRSWIFYPHYQPVTYVHELGHNLGIAHANGLFCGHLPIGDSCKSVEYGNFLDVMGSGVTNDGNFTPFHMNGPNKLVAGWISGRVKHVTESGIYSIKPLEIPTTEGYQLITISRPQDKDHYYLEYRQPLNYDKLISEPNTSGAILHIRNNTPLEPSNLVNVNVGESSYDSPTFTDGKVFTDPYNRIKIRQISHDENQVTLEITLGD